MDDARRCRATNRAGQRCGKAAILGGTVCRNHGGASPQVRMAAAERLKALQHTAIDAIERGLAAEADLNIATRTGLAVLDRTGLGPHSTVNVEGSLGERLAALDGHDSD